jgi:hypothetical protein
MGGASLTNAARISPLWYLMRDRNRQVARWGIVDTAGINVASVL